MSRSIAYNSFIDVRGQRPMKRAQILLGVFLMLGITSINFINPYDKPLETLLLASAVIVLGFWPLYRWLGNQSKDYIPILALHGVFYSICFGLAGFIEPVYSDRISVSEEFSQLALLMTLLGLLSLYISYYLIGSIIIGNRTNWQWPLQIRSSGYFFLVLVFLIFAIIKYLIINEKLIIFSEIISFVNIFIFFFLLHAKFLGQLPKFISKLFITLVLPYHLVFTGGLTDSLSSGFVMTAIFVGITYMVTLRHVPYLWMLLALGVFIFLTPAKGEFRNIIWTQKIELSSIERIQTFFNIGWDYYFDHSNNTMQTNNINEGFHRSLNRINHLQTTAVIIADTPARQPFLYGETYLPILTKWVPRLIWPGKPIEDLGNRWARQYGYLDANDYGTSYNLPWLPEMYMNFGLAGVIGVNFLIGIIFCFLAVNFWRTPRDSSSFAFGMVLGSPLIYVESHLSMTLGGLIISFISLVVYAFIASKLMPRIFVWNKWRV